MTNANEIEKFICDTYGRNGFVHYCNIAIESIKCGEAILSFEVEDDKHTNGAHSDMSILTFAMKTLKLPSDIFLIYVQLILMMKK